MEKYAARESKGPYPQNDKQIATIKLIQQQDSNAQVKDNQFPPTRSTFRLFLSAICCSRN